MLSRIAWLPVVIASVELIALAALWIWMWSRRERTPTIWQFLLIVLTVRFALFATPLSWFGYYSAIGSAYMDARERDIVANKIKTFLLPAPEQKFLAVGSSQTRAIYSQFSKNNPILGYYVLAGMQPADYVDQYADILRRRPKVILLYVSEFDLGRPVDLSTSRLSDMPAWEWPDFYRSVAAARGPKTAWDVMVGIAIADLFPENKYSFIYADYLKQLRSKLSGLPAETPSVDRQTRIELNSLNHLTATSVRDQLIFLETFLRRAERDRMPVVVVEGQYNPIAYTPNNVALNRDVVEPALADIQRAFPNVSVVRRSDVRQFTRGDYEDAYHVKPEAGDRFVAELLHLLKHQALVRPVRRRHDRGVSITLTSKRAAAF